MLPFKNYVKLATNHYREHFGLDFEQFKVGQIFEHRPGITLSQQDNAEEALDTINNAQLHYDEHYAAQTEWKSCLGVSTMTLQKVIGMTSKTFARKSRIKCFKDIAMTHPVFGGDTLYSRSEIVAKEALAEAPDQGCLTVKTEGINQKGEVVATIVYELWVYKAGMHPLEKADKLSREGIDDAKFASHRLLDNEHFMEQVGIYFEDLMPGEIYEHRPGKTFTMEENSLHALRSLELNPQYNDLSYASRFMPDGLMIAESFLVGVVTALTTRTFDRVVANLGWNNIDMLQPVHVGDTIYAVSEILDKRESHSRPSQGIMHVKSSAFNQNNQKVCEYERHFLIYKKGMGPYKNAGY